MTQETTTDNLTAKLEELDAWLRAEERDWNAEDDMLGNTYAKVNVTGLRVLLAEAKGLWAAKREAIEALGAMPEGFCFCSANRVGDDSKVHEPECRDLRAALSRAPIQPAS